MTYSVHSLFLTAQGEGANIGRAAVFVRFAGCNLWSGRERDRATAACRFCDTEFVGGTRYLDAEAGIGLLQRIFRRTWREALVRNVTLLRHALQQQGLI